MSTLDQERREWQRVTAAGLLILLALLIGFCIGVLAGRRPDPSWFEAVGTWVGAGVSGLAVFLAFRIFRSEDFMRRIDAARAEREYLGHEKQLERSQRLDAATVRAELEMVEELELTDGVTSLNPHFRYKVFNRAPQAIERVWVRHASLNSGDWVYIGQVIGSNESATHRLIPTNVESDSNTIEWLVATTEIRFTMHGKGWMRVGVDTLNERPLDKRDE